MDSCLLRWSLEEQGTAVEGNIDGPGGAVGYGCGGRGGGGGGGAGSRASRDELLERARRAFQAAEARLLDDDEAVQTCLDNVSPHSTIIEALKGCELGPLLLTSTLPADLGHRVLTHCGLAPHSPDLEPLFGCSWTSAVAQV
ncbi:hypothetical protein GPECTOR_1g262 [Gonium pectorale]|uniref:Uncharacterized protein n=1 Tax=Gonium pectorale TaxID=33097 RepID=A0A150H381_GONPE|nr:hypothetical protein GPECTOR_1g262 [Gonium pectorale]|eukprot:KXZ56298.1 hypothetical protein GPECTOR_1g262 [Gonium pectorale]